MTADRERRKAKSREAAKKRRSLESGVFGDLTRLLPLPASVRAQLDKPSVLRLTISHIHTRTLITGVTGTVNSQTENYSKEQECNSVKTSAQDQRENKNGALEELTALGERELYLGVLEGFLLLVAANGNIIFLSHNVSKHMGLTQVELMGQSIYDFTHPCDHEEIQNNLHHSPGDRLWGTRREFVMRMKNTMTQRGKTTNIKSATWKVIHCQGRMKACSSSTLPCLLLTCQPLPCSHRLDSRHTFVSQHTMDMRFTHCDHRMTLLLGYSVEEILGRSLYDICHTLDTSLLIKSHMNLLSMSQSVSGQYRMLARAGGYVWVESHSAIVPCLRSIKSTCGPEPHQPVCVLCVTYVLSGVEKPSLQLSLDQIL